MNVYVFSASDIKIPNSETWTKKHQFLLHYHTTDKDANLLFSCKKPDVFVTCSEGECSDFTTLFKMPLYIRKRWIHVHSLKDLTPTMIDNCFIGALNAKLGPTISVFITTYKSGDKILRPFNSLRKQTFTEWEAVIMDDSPEEDKDETWERIKSLAEQDCRIRIFKQKGNDGYIGSVKNCTATMARGAYILELDHDDELLPEALELTVLTFEKHPEVSMVGSDCSEIYEGTFNNFEYGSYFGMGRHGYYRERYNNRWVNVSRNGCLDRYTIRHIVGVLNHLRAWRYDTYVKLRGHDFNLNVADDYELIIRTFLIGRIARLPRFLYIQYRNEGSNNFTVIRNALIQKLVAIIVNLNDDKIHDRLLELGLSDFDKGENGKYNNFKAPPNIYLDHTPDLSADLLLDPYPKDITIITSTYKRPEWLRRSVKSILKQDFKNWVLYIVGDKCPSLHQTMADKMFYDPRIRYWNMHIAGKDGSVPKNYGLKILASTDYIAYLDDDNYWESNHLSSLYKKLTKDSDTMYAFSSFKTEGFPPIICREPKLYRIDTSCLLHKRSLLQKYGYWRTRFTSAGYATDFDLVSRWIKGKEKWVCTELPTVFYENSNQNMKAIYEAYGDQIPLDKNQEISVAKPVKDLPLTVNVDTFRQSLDEKQLEETVIAEFKTGMSKGNPFVINMQKVTGVLLEKLKEAAVIHLTKVSAKIEEIPNDNPQEEETIIEKEDTEQESQVNTESESKKDEVD